MQNEQSPLQLPDKIRLAASVAHDVATLLFSIATIILLIVAIYAILTIWLGIDIVALLKREVSQLDIDREKLRRMWGSD